LRAQRRTCIFKLMRETPPRVQRGEQPLHHPPIYISVYI
jgi:hypothetical protein